MATRWACLGTGKIANDFFKAIEDNLPKDEHSFVAVGSRCQERAQTFAKKFQFKRAYDTYEKVAMDMEVEVVYISTYSSEHFRLSIMMLKAGKHVLCEKPMALNEKQVREVFQTAKECNRFFSEGMWSRCMPMYDIIKQELANKSVGEVTIVRANINFPAESDSPNLSMDKRGGTTVTLGIYPVQFATLVFNEMPEKIIALGNVAPSGLDENVSAILKYKSGALATLTFAFRTAYKDCRGVILGDKGAIEVNTPLYAPTKVTTPSGVFEQKVVISEGYNFPNSELLNIEARVVRDIIKRGGIENSYWTMEDTLLAYKIMDEIRRQVGVKYPEDDRK